MGKLRVRNNLVKSFKYVKANHKALITFETFTKNYILLNKK